MMGVSICTTVLLLALYASGFTSAADPAQEKADIVSSAPNLAVSVSASFPSLSDELGLKIFNGQQTKVVLEFTNSESEPITISSVKGALSSLKSTPSDLNPTNNVIHNLKSARYNVEVKSGEKQSLPYLFTTDLQPEDLRINIIATISNQEGSKYQLQAFNKTVTIVDLPASIFDPQILFLYSVLIGISGLFIFWAGKTWIQPLFPQNKHGARTNGRVKRSKNPAKGSTSSEEQSPVFTSNGSADVSISSGYKTYDESWIPDHHIKKPKVKRVKGSSSKKNLKNDGSK